MKKNSVELQDKIAQLKEEQRKITAKCRTEVRQMNSEETERIAAIKAEIIEAREELRQLEESLKKKPEPEPNNKPNVNIMEKKETPFSLVKAIRNAAAHKEQPEEIRQVLAMGEQEMAAAGVGASNALHLPSELRAVTVATEHDDVIATDLFDIVGTIKNKSILTQLGANMLSGLVGDVQIPVGSDAAADWYGETSTAETSTPTFTNVKLTPKRLACAIDVSNQMLKQDSVGMENYLRRIIIEAIQNKLEATVLGNAAGSTTKPAGLFYLATGTHTVVDSFADVCALESAFDGKTWGERKYALSAGSKAAFRSMIKGTNATGMVYENGEIDGVKALDSAFVYANHLAYGDWSNLLIGAWGGIDLIVDEKVLALSGQTRLIAGFYCDVQLLRSDALVFATTATV